MKEDKDIEIKDELAQIKKCLRDKDKRIYDLESYFELRRKLILTFDAISLGLYPLILIFLFVDSFSDDAPSKLNMFVRLMASIGIIVSAFVPAALGFIVVDQIWSGEKEEI